MVRPQKIKKARSIRSDLFVLIVLIAFVPLVLYFLFDLFSLTRELKRDVRLEFENLAGHFGGDLAVFLSDRLNDLKLLSENSAIRSSWVSPEEKMRQMNRVQEYYHYFDDITLVSVDGSVVLSTTYSFYSDLSKTRWFSEAKEGKAVITDPYRDLSGKDLMISFFLPIVDNGRIVSILSARMNMKEIWKRADSVRFGEFGHIIILDRFGTIIAHPDRGMIFKKLDAAGITGTVEGGATTLPVDYTDEDGVEYVGALVVMGQSPLYEMTPLLILAVQAKNEAYALSNYVLIRDLLEMIIVLSLIILVSLYFTAKLTQPIQTIIEGAEKISGGELGAVVDVKSWREINSIADAFNMMSVGLMDYTRELKNSEGRYRTLVEDIDDGYYLIKDDRIVFANEAAFDMLGYERSEVIGRKIYDFIPDQSWDKTAGLSRQVIEQNDIPAKIELPLKKKNGELIFIEARPTAVSMGGDVLIAGIFVDVSARRRREDLLREDREFLEQEVQKKSRELFESEVRYRTIFESAADGIFLCEVDGVVISANRAMSEILGFSPIGMKYSDFFSTIFGTGGDVAPETLKQRIVDGEESISLDRSVTIDGRGALNLDIKMNSIDIGGPKQYILGVVRDTTQRKAIETALINSKRRLQAAFDAVSDRMYMVDSGYILRFVNMSIAEELSRGFREILDRPCYSFFNTRPEPCVNCPLGAVKKGAQGLAADVAVSYPEGARVFRVSAYPVLPLSDSDDFLIYSRDITEEKKLQEHLIQSDRLISLGQLSAGVAHEVNNPLTSILGYAQLLLMDKDEQSDDHRELKIIEQQAMNCKAILNDLLLFSRTRVDRKEYFDINEVLDGVVVINKMEIRDRGIDLEKKYHRRLPAFFGDQIRMTQVFLNILKNAVDAVDNGGRIVLTTKYSRAKREIRVSIEDNGYGIDREQMQKIFDPFFTTKPPGKGTGLGLSVSYGIVAEHGGRIDVESEAGGGARFTVVLPFLEKDEEPS